MSDAKPRLICVTDPVEIEALEAGDLSTPHGIQVDGRWYADADEMRLWRDRLAGALVH